MGQIDMDFLGRQLQVYRGHAPRMFDAENEPVKLTIFHDYWMAIHVFGVPSVRPTGGMHKGVSAERFETPFVGGAACLWRRGGNPPAPAFPRRGKRERGRSNFLAAAGNYPGDSPAGVPLRASPASPYSHSRARIPRNPGVY